MMNREKKVDDYIQHSEKFAIPVLKHLRKLIHESCPDVKETIKWGFPHFEYQGILCSFASFKQHCAFTLWKADLITDKQGILQSGKEKSAMGNFGRIAHLNDLPDDEIILDFLRQAVQLNEAGIKPVVSKNKTNISILVPDAFSSLLRKNKKAATVFDNLSTSHKKEYLTWITEAKKEETSQRRMENAITMLSEGKTRNARYNKK